VRRIVVFAVLVILLMVLMIPTALADHNVGPCNDSAEPGNSDYAQHHIVPATLGNDAHKPGSHRGFSLCIPQEGWK
jgi:hypothetical protein